MGPTKEEGVPEMNADEYFSDACKINISPSTATLTFEIRRIVPEGVNQDVALIRMPTVEAKIMAIILLRTIRRYEQESNVTIAVPDRILNELGIAREDWGGIK